MNIYVGNLPYNLNDDELKEAFAGFGNVTSSNVIKDKFTGESRGFGFVEMSDKDEAEKAINAMNGADFQGRKLVVNEARPRTERPPRSGGFGDGGGGGGRRDWNDRGGRGGDRDDRGGDRRYSR